MVTCEKIDNTSKMLSYCIRKVLAARVIEKSKDDRMHFECAQMEVVCRISAGQSVAWAWIPTLPFISCVSLGELFHHIQFPFFFCNKNWDTNCHLGRIIAKSNMVNSHMRVSQYMAHVRSSIGLVQFHWKHSNQE